MVSVALVYAPLIFCKLLMISMTLFPDNSYLESCAWLCLIRCARLLRNAEISHRLEYNLEIGLCLIQTESCSTIISPCSTLENDTNLFLQGTVGIRRYPSPRPWLSCQFASVFERQWIKPLRILLAHFEYRSLVTALNFDNPGSYILVHYAYRVDGVPVILPADDRLRMQAQRRAQAEQ